MPINRRRPAGFAWITSLLTVVSLIAACGGGGGGAAAPAPPPSTYSIGGAINGLIGSIVLQNNGGDNLTVSADGAFTFPSELNNSTNFAVTVLTQPAGQSCSVSSDSGTVSGSDVTTVQVQCTPAPPVLAIAGRQVKAFRFTWVDVTGETEYRLLEDLNGNSAFVLRGVLAADNEQADIEVFIPERANARYIVQACYSGGCIDSNVVDAADALNGAVGYVKASDADASDIFGAGTGGVALSADGSTLAVSAYLDDSNATGVNGDATNNSAIDSGAVYVYIRVGPGAWAQQAYIKASNTEADDLFGYSLGLSNDGNTLAVSALNEDSAATGINGDEADNSVNDPGAAYVFVREADGSWNQQAYVKASNPETLDQFGWSVALSGDGDTLAVGAVTEAGGAPGINGNQADNSVPGSGATYVFAREPSGNWSQQAYIKASVLDVEDRFGWVTALSGNGDTLVVGAIREDSNADGIDGDNSDNAAPQSGAAYVFVRDNLDAWTQQAYVKASNSDTNDFFGYSVALSDDSSTLAVGAFGEFSSTTGINGNQADNSAPNSGAAYVFVSDGFGGWSQQAYIKASNTSVDDVFGVSIGLSGDGSKMAISAGDDSASTGIAGDQFDDTAPNSGAVYLFSRDGTAVWEQQSYIKSPNSETDDFFGETVWLSDDGLTLSVGAPGEDSAAGPGGDQSDNSQENAGAAYIY